MYIVSVVHLTVAFRDVREIEGKTKCLLLLHYILVTIAGLFERLIFSFAQNFISRYSLASHHSRYMSISLKIT